MARQGRRRLAGAPARFQLTEDQIAETVRQNPEVKLYHCPCGARGLKTYLPQHQRTLSCQQFHARLFRKGLRPASLSMAWDLFYEVRPYLTTAVGSEGQPLGLLDPAPWAPDWIRELLWTPRIPFYVMADVIRRQDRRAAGILAVGVEAGMDRHQLAQAARVDVVPNCPTADLHSIFLETPMWRGPNYYEVERNLVAAVKKELAYEALWGRTNSDWEKANRQEIREGARSLIPAKGIPRPAPWHRTK